VSKFPGQNPPARDPFPKRENRYYLQIEPRRHFIPMLPWDVFLARSEAAGSGRERREGRDVSGAQHGTEAGSRAPRPAKTAPPKCRNIFAPSSLPLAQSTRDGVSSRTARNLQKTNDRAPLYPRRFPSPIGVVFDSNFTSLEQQRRPRATARRCGREAGISAWRSGRSATKSSAGHTSWVRPTPAAIPAVGEELASPRPIGPTARWDSREFSLAAARPW
jgi:hypothetical protein